MAVVVSALGYCHYPATVTVAPTIDNVEPAVALMTYALVKGEQGQPVFDAEGKPQTVPATSFAEGDTVIVRGRVTDPAFGVSTEVLCPSKVAWGDGSDQSLPINPYDGTFELTHVYADDNPSGSPQDPYRSRPRSPTTTAAYRRRPKPSW